MFHDRIIIVIALVACFSHQFVPAETIDVINKLKGIARSVCDFFHPSHKSSTPEVTPVYRNLETISTTPIYDIDPRANEDGIPVQPRDGDSGLSRNLINVNGECPPGQGKIGTGQCRPIYNN